MEQHHDAYEILPFPRSREGAIDLLRTAQRKHMIHALIEVDVTVPRQLIREHKACTGESLSFTAFIVSCVAKTVDEDKTLHAYRNWRNQIVVFDEVDVNTMIERRVGDRTMGTPCILRAANRKTLGQIHQEIRAAQAQPTEAVAGMEWFRWASWLALLPGFVRGWMWRAAFRSPRLVKQFAGTVGVTAVGMFGMGGGWGLTIPLLTLNLVVGGIAQKPGVVEGRIEAHEYLHLTISIDHDIIDGAPAARFARRLAELIETGYGLTPVADGCTS